MKSVASLLLIFLLRGYIGCAGAQSVGLGESEILEQPSSLRELNADVGQIESFYLINANNERPIRLIQNGDVINIANRVTSNFNIEALTTDGTIGSVEFGYQRNPNFRTENYPPYTLCGNNDDNYFVCGALVNGLHTVTATPFLYPGAQGPAGKTVRITFTIVDRAPAPVPKAPTRAPFRRPPAPVPKPPTRAPIRRPPVPVPKPPTRAPIRRPPAPVPKPPTRAPIRQPSWAPKSCKLPRVCIPSCFANYLHFYQGVNLTEALD
jgi:hypothetical protein